MDYGYALPIGFALGFSLTIPPGPMNALIALQTVRSLRAGIITGFGAMSADLVLGVLVYALRTVIDVGLVIRWVYVVGAAVMAFFGYRLLLRRPEPGPGRASGTRTYSQAFVVGVSNPFQIVWWLTAGLAFAYLSGVVLLVGLFAAVSIWVLAFPYVLHLGTRRRPGLERAVTYTSIAIMFVFSVYFAILAW